MTLGAAFIEPCHRKPAGGFEDVISMGIMALHAGHVTLDHGVMLRKAEFGVNIEVALETRIRLAARIDDKMRAAPRLNVSAAGAVA